jgi:hypothetical protein
MLEGLVLQFSALHFYFPRQEKKSLKEKKGETAFQWGTFSYASPTTRSSLAVMCYKKLIQGLLIEHYVYPKY